MIEGHADVRAGAVPDSQFKGDAPVTEGSMRRPSPFFRSSLRRHKPADSRSREVHYHSDHTANANAFAGATWMARRRSGISGSRSRGNIQPHITTTQDGEDQDRTTKIRCIRRRHGSSASRRPDTRPDISAIVKLAKRGQCSWRGIYTNPKSEWAACPLRVQRRSSKASREKVEAFLKQTGAQLWIEHVSPRTRSGLWCPRTWSERQGKKGDGPLFGVGKQRRRSSSVTTQLFAPTRLR